MRRWNETQRGYRRDASIPVLFEERAVEKPDHTAVRCGERTITYRQLNEQANRLAHRLRGLGVGPDVLVGICLPRSIEMVVGMLGIAKAGGAYLPLDEKYPAERINLMLEDSRAGLIVGSVASLARVAPVSARLVTVDDRDLEGERSSNPDSVAGGEHLAYVIYTSGSTGRPKGVMVPHRAVLNLVCNADYVRLDGEQIVAQCCSSSFDPSVFEIWGALLNGATLAVIDSESLAVPARFLEQLRVNRVTTVLFSTQILNQVVRFAPGALSHLENVMTGGETADPRTFQAIREHGPPKRLVNTYGPTEATMLVSAFPGLAMASGGETIPIGRPIANTQFYVVDDEMRPVAEGDSGELLIAGDNLARGYLGHPELTRERFAPHPFDDTPGARVYRTGDTVRWLPDGNVEFVGRVDHQVKIRGYRVELGEVESALRQHPAVKEAVVVAKPDRHGGKRLVAYLLAPELPPSVRRLREFIGSRLPAHMVPSAFVVLPALPMDPNNKIDRSALPEPPRARQLDGELVAPRSPLEALIAGVWSQILDVEQVGARDEFAELGGTSLSATAALSRLESLLELRLPARQVLQAKTIAELAEILERNLPSVSERAAAAAESGRGIARRELSGDAPTTFAEQLFHALAVLPLSVIIRIEGPLDVPALERSLDEILRRHDGIRTTFHTESGRLRRRVAPHTGFQLPVVDLQSTPPEERERAARALALETIGGVRHEPAPLFRARLLRVGQRSFILVAAAPHLVWDGWCFPLFYRELGALYDAFHAQRGSPLPELPFQLADYARHQDERHRRGELDEQIAYWKKRFAASRSFAPDLPPRPGQGAGPAGRVSQKIPSALVASLSAISKRCETTLFTTLLAAYKVVLRGRSPEQPEVTVGLTQANRHEAGTDQLLGCLVQLWTLTTGIEEEAPFEELLGRVRQGVLDAYEHPQEYPPAEIPPPNSWTKMPCELLFNYYNFPSDPPKLAGVELELTELPITETPGARTGFVLHTQLYDEADGLLVNWTYNQEVLLPASVERIADSFRRVLERLAAGGVRESARDLLGSADPKADHRGPS